MGKKHPRLWGNIPVYGVQVTPMELEGLFKGDVSRNIPVYGVQVKTREIDSLTKRRLLPKHPRLWGKKYPRKDLTGGDI